MIWTDEMKQYLAANIDGCPYKEITKKINEKFGTDFSWQCVKSAIKRYGLRNGRVTRFEKGIVPHNKGKAMDEETYKKVKNTMFKKGNIPKNHKEVGSERITKDGYIEIKVDEPNKWELKHRFVYEKEFGKIEKNECILFLDQNKQNCSLDNLLKIKRSELVVLSQYGMSSTHKEHTEAYVNIARVVAKAREVKKRCKSDKTGH